MRILTSWLSLMDSNGWIAREQIPGAEARQNVPNHLCIQNPHYANPPGFLLSVNQLLHKFASSVPGEETKAILVFLKSNYEKFKRNYFWYLTTQVGFKERDYLAFRWRGRSTHHTLTSGLDDYPRADLPNPFELHVDLASWMALASKVMAKYAGVIGELADSEMFEQNHDKIVKTIETLHWDEESGSYTDIIYEEGRIAHNIRHFGYVSLFPLLLGLARDDRVQRLLTRVSKELVTEHGLCSLSPSSSYYLQGDQYWTGPIWVNMNYLFVSALCTRYSKVGGALSLGSKVRSGLVRCMLKSFQETGFIWEQYNDSTGKGQRSHPFTGWSSLVVLLMSEKYQSF